MNSSLSKKITSFQNKQHDMGDDFGTAVGLIDSLKKMNSQESSKESRRNTISTLKMTASQIVNQ